MELRSFGRKPPPGAFSWPWGGIILGRENGAAERRLGESAVTRSFNRCRTRFSRAVFTTSLGRPDCPGTDKRVKLRKFETPVEHAMRFLYVRRPGRISVFRQGPTGRVLWDVLNVIQQEALR